MLTVIQFSQIKELHADLCLAVCCYVASFIAGVLGLQAFLFVGSQSPAAYVFTYACMTCCFIASNDHCMHSFVRIVLAGRC